MIFLDFHEKITLLEVQFSTESIILGPALNYTKFLYCHTD